MELDDDELKATRILNGTDKKDKEYKIKQLEIHIANHLDDEQWKNWQEVLKYINELQKNQCDHNISNECIRKQETNDLKQSKIEYLEQVIEKQQTEIEAQKMEHNYDVKMIDEVKGEANKLYKMIDLMAEQLSTPLNSKEWVKEYYRKKVEE